MVKQVQTRLNLSSDGNILEQSPVYLVNLNIWLWPTHPHKYSSQGPFDPDLDRDEILEQAVIYKRDKVRPLTKYQRCINETAQELSLQNPLLLRSRQKLLCAAREKVDVTYQFKKGKSRSKRHASSSDEQPPKRAKVCQDVRENRMKLVQEEISNLNERLSYKRKRRLAAETVKIINYVMK